MGCIDSKESGSIGTLKGECNYLMYENILALQVVQYLLVEKGNISLAIRVISLKKRTENYYSIITQYRNYWILNAKKKKKVPDSLQDIKNCLEQQTLELQQLQEAEKVLSNIIEKLKPKWKETFSSLEKLKDHLEESKSIIMHSSSLYGSYYSEDFRKMKIAALEHSQNIQNFDNDIYDQIKAVTVCKYKVLEKRVYYTSKIVHMKIKDAKDKSKNFNSREDLIYNLKSFEVNHSNSGLAILEEPQEIIINEQESVDSQSDSSFVDQIDDNFERVANGHK
jgi:hypothetical protein